MIGPEPDKADVMNTFIRALLVSAAALATPAWAASDVVTIYSADGLHDGKGSWFETQFDAFTKATGIKVQYVEAGSGGVVERVAKEKSNPQADVLVTLPPFIQRAEAEGLLQKFTPAAADRDRRRRRQLPAARVQLSQLHLRLRRASRRRRRPTTNCSIPSSRARSSIRRPARPATARRSCCR